MLGTIGLTCAFPFAGDELYGQHVHVTLAQAAGDGPVRAGVLHAGRIRHAVAPHRRDHPGHQRRQARSHAGVPGVHRSRRLAERRASGAGARGLAWLETAGAGRGIRARLPGLSGSRTHRHPAAAQRRGRSPAARGAANRRFRTDAKRGLVYYVAINDKSSPASAAADAPARATSLPTIPTCPVRLFRLIKNLTADGYYTSRVGLVEELGYTGNTALASFPSCTIREQ